MGYYDKKIASAEDEPLFPSMISSMKVDFVFNHDGGAWLLHDKPLPDILKWVEYDGDTGSLILVTRSGRIQDLGMRIPVEKGHHLQSAPDVTVLLVEQGKIGDFTIVPLITRITAMH